MSSQQTHTKTRYSIPSALLAADYIASTICHGEKKANSKNEEEEKNGKRNVNTTAKKRTDNSGSD